MTSTIEIKETGHVNDGYEDTEITKDGDSIKDKSGNENSDLEPVDERPTWGNSLEFLMSCISMSVGLGNIWRFPFTALENGGGAFLIPYIIVLILVGKPMYYMEMVLGQFTARNNIRIWVVTPSFKGVGMGQLIACASVVSYYVSLMALTFFYLIQSFSSVLPWSYCREEWKPDCFSASDSPTDNSTGLTSSSELYFLKIVLNEIDDLEDGIGLPNWKLTLCLLFSWILIFLVMIRGVKSSGKAAYFLALFPYVIMFALLIRAATLPGSVDGIIYFIKPQWEELYNPKVWYAAVTQVFFSLSVCIGSIIMFSSYNRFSHNIYRDSMIVTTLDTFTSLLAGFTIFGILGNLAYEMGTDDIGSVIGTGGTGLAFISYPDAISKFDWAPQLFAVLFFLMLFVIGLGSAVALHSAVVTVLADYFTRARFWQMALIACLSGFIIGLVYVTPGGQFVLTLVDKFGGTFLILGMAILEIVGILWIYGLENFCEDIEFMTGRKVSMYWRWCWGFITPVIMVIVFLFAFLDPEPLKYGDKEYTKAALIGGWGILAFGLLQLPVWAVVSYVKRRDGNTWKETLCSIFKPSEKWGPKDPKIKEEWKRFKIQAKENIDSYENNKLKHIFYTMIGKYRNSS